MNKHILQQYYMFFSFHNTQAKLHYFGNLLKFDGEKKKNSFVFLGGWIDRRAP